MDDLLIPKVPKHKRIKDTKKRPMNAIERRHAERIQAMRCIVPMCGQPAEIHHETGSPRQKRDHMLIVPLCPYHHRHGKHSRHTMGYRQFCELIGKDLMTWAKTEREKSLRAEAMR